MPDARHPFTPSSIMYAPALPGVYMLWDRDVLLFVGHASAPETILGRLMDHYCARARPAQATHCSWELINVAAWLERVGPAGFAAEETSQVYAEVD